MPPKLILMPTRREVSRVQMDERKLRILHEIIEDYILTAMPVGSRTISRKYETGLSSATIRNEMSDLEALGYLEQPHVSAGRVPSLKAYRLYVDGALGDMRIAPDSHAQAKRAFVEKLRQMEDVVVSTAQALADMTHYTAVVVMPKQSEMRISCLQLVPMPRGAALLVIVTDSGAIRDTVIRVSETLDSDALYAISRMMTERLSGHTLGEVQDMLRDLSRHAGANARVLQGIADLASQMERQNSTDTVAVGGSHNILKYPEYSDVDKARAFLSALDARNQLISLITDAPDRFHVHIGPETGIPEMQECSVVSASYGVFGEHRGAIGVIGPTRMPYMQVLSTLSAVSEALSELLSE